MKRIIGGVTLIVGLLSASGGMAYAECAWVLWHSSILIARDKASATSGPQHWGVMQAFASTAEGKKACDDMVTTLLLRKSSSASMIDTFVCLPDTVDPRGPKGK